MIGSCHKEDIDADSEARTSDDFSEGVMAWADSFSGAIIMFGPICFGGVSQSSHMLKGASSRVTCTVEMSAVDHRCDRVAY